MHFDVLAELSRYARGLFCAGPWVGRDSAVRGRHMAAHAEAHFSRENGPALQARKVLG